MAIHIDTAAVYSSINSTAFVAQVVPHNVDKPILTIVTKSADEPLPTNVATIIQMIRDCNASLEHTGILDGAIEMRNNQSDIGENIIL